MTNIWDDPKDDLPTRAELGTPPPETPVCYWCLETHEGVCPEAPYFISDENDLPAWAEIRVYEYDLGMSTSCEQCAGELKEGQRVLKDKENLNSYYCSPECAWRANES